MGGRAGWESRIANLCTPLASPYPVYTPNIYFILYILYYRLLRKRVRLANAYVTPPLMIIRISSSETLWSNTLNIYYMAASQVYILWLLRKLWESDCDTLWERGAYI